MELPDVAQQTHISEKVKRALPQAAKMAFESI
jgi:hypothetical protein